MQEKSRAKHRRVRGVRATTKKYRNLEPDIAVAVLVTLAALGTEKIVTVDGRDFSAYRLKNGRAFKRLWS